VRITPRNILLHELIGLEVEVFSSKNPAFKGIKGVVVDETLNLLVIETEKRERKKVPKELCVFKFRLPDGVQVLVSGSAIRGRPEDRLKKKIRYW